MPNTQGFQVVTQVSVNFLRQLLRTAWKSGGRKLGEPIEPGTIPESLDFVGTFGSFAVKDGQIQIPRDQLDIALVPNAGVDIKVGVKGQAHLQNAQNPDVPSLALQDITADIHVIAPIGKLVGPGHGLNDIGVQLNLAPKPKVTLTGPDPAGRLDQLIAEQIRNLAAGAPKLPTVDGVTLVYRSVPAYTVSELLEILNDSFHQIEVVRLPGSPPHLQIKLPVQLSLYNATPKPGLNPPPPLLQGILTEARLVVTALLEGDPLTPGGFKVQLNAPTTTLSVEGIAPKGDLSHYKGNQARLGIEFDSIVENEIRKRGFEFLQQLGNLAISIPTVASIQDALATFIQTQMVAINSIPVWPPKASGPLPLTIADAAVKILADALVLAINSGAGADANALTNLIPPSRDLAFAISAEGVNNIFEATKIQHNPFHRYHGDDHDFDLKSLSLSLRTGAVHLDGDMTVIDAIAGSIDLDASFGSDVHLSWGPSNSILAKPDNPDVHTKLSFLGWLITLILGFLTAGGLGVVIAIIIDKVCETVAANIGADIVKDPNFTSIAAWPSDLGKIGNVEAHFDNPIDIAPDGLMFSATVQP